MMDAKDVEKFNALIGGIPGGHQDIAIDESSLRIANKNWPMLRTVAAAAISIPAVPLNRT